MIEVEFESFWAENERRARELGLLTPEMTDHMRNKGANRTPEKRELLRRMAERAQAARVKPPGSSRRGRADQGLSLIRHRPVSRAWRRGT